MDPRNNRSTSEKMRKDVRTVIKDLSSDEPMDWVSSGFSRWRDVEGYPCRSCCVHVCAHSAAPYRTGVHLDNDALV